MIKTSWDFFDWIITIIVSNFHFTHFNFTYSPVYIHAHTSLKSYSYFPYLLLSSLRYPMKYICTNDLIYIFHQQDTFISQHFLCSLASGQKPNRILSYALNSQKKHPHNDMLWWVWSHVVKGSLCDTYYYIVDVHEYCCILHLQRVGWHFTGVCVTATQLPYSSWNSCQLRVGTAWSLSGHSLTRRTSNKMVDGFISSLFQ